MISFAIITKLIQRMERFGLTVSAKFTTVKDRLNLHQTQLSKLQNMQPDEIGLGQLPNYPPATRNQAQGAINNNSLMTPRRTDDWAQVNVYGPIGQAFKDAAARL